MNSRKRLSTQLASNYLGVSVPTLNRWRGDKTGPVYYALGGAVFYYEEDLEKYLENARVEPDPSNPIQSDAH